MVCSSQPHVPEQRPDEQLAEALTVAEEAFEDGDTPAIDAAYAGVDAVLNSEFTALEHVYSGLTLLSEYRVPDTALQHWVEDAGNTELLNLGRALHEKALYGVTHAILSKDTLEETLGFQEPQPACLAQYPAPAQTFEALRDDVEQRDLWDAEQRDLWDLVDEFRETFSEWPLIVQATHIAHLTDELDVSHPESDQYSHVPPQTEALSYVFSSVLDDMTAAHLAGSQ